MKIANALALAALLGSAATAQAQSPQQTPPTPAPAAAPAQGTAKAEAKKTEKTEAKATETSHAAHHKTHVAKSASSTEAKHAAKGVTKAPFGQTKEGVPVDLFTLTNRNGMVAKVMTYGATLTDLLVPDRQGKLDDVVLGFDKLEPYLAGTPYFGAIVGRVAATGFNACSRDMSEAARRSDRPGVYFIAAARRGVSSPRTSAAGSSTSTV